MTQLAQQDSSILSVAEQAALSRYAAALQPRKILDVTHTHEGYLVVVTRALDTEEAEMTFMQTMAKVGTEILLDTGVYILLEQH